MIEAGADHFGDAVLLRGTEARVQEVRHKDEQSPMALLEPNEQVVARLLAQGLTNEQIAARLGFRDKRTISRTNGQIYAAWGLDVSATDEKVARTRASTRHSRPPTHQAKPAVLK